VLLVDRVQLEAGYGYRKNDSTEALRILHEQPRLRALTFHFKPVEAGRLPPSYAAGLVAGGTPSGGSLQAAEVVGAPGTER